MSAQITTAFVNEYRSTIDLLLQQKGSILRPTVRQERQNSEFEYFDRIGSTEAQERTTRHGDTPLMETPHDRRQVSLRDFDWADLIDEPDRVRTITDPTSAYSINAAFALGRKADDVIIDKFFGDAKSGKTGSTTVTFPVAQQVAVNYVESGSAANSGLTVAKLRRARTILRAGQVQKDEKLFCGVTAQQIQDLLRTTEVTSADYNMVKALVQGELNTFMGFEFVEIERLAVDDNSYRRIPVWAMSGMLLSIGTDIKARVTERADKNYSTQVYANASFGATRMEEGKVVEIKCSEA